MASDPCRIVPVMTVPWPRMEKQWSTAIRRSPPGSLWGRYVCVFRSCNKNQKRQKWDTRGKITSVVLLQGYVCLSNNRNTHIWTLIKKHQLHCQHCLISTAKSNISAQIKYSVFSFDWTLSTHSRELLLWFFVNWQTAQLCAVLSNISNIRQASVCFQISPLLNLALPVAPLCQQPLGLQASLPQQSLDNP